MVAVVINKQIHLLFYNIIKYHLDTVQGTSFTMFKQKLPKDPQLIHKKHMFLSAKLLVKEIICVKSFKSKM